MTEASKQWEGQIVEGIFPLRQYLGGSDHSAVFLTEYGGGKPQEAAIKLFPADPVTADLQLSSWEFAGQLSHPNLLQLFRSGRCRLDGNDLLYLVMEYAEEDLSQILPQRALTPEETRDMLCPVLDALEYLHGKGFVHGDLKPANILASGDQLKLSSDTISRAGEAQASSKRPGVYDPPEAISGMLTPAADVWSLGATLVEVLTQRLPEWQPGPNREPVVPANLPAPFLEIARQCLRLEPQRRATVAMAGQVSPLKPQPIASLPEPIRGAPRMQNNPHRPPPYRESGARPRFLIPLVVGALLFAAILTVPRLLPHRPDGKSAATAAQEKPTGQAPVQKPSESTDTVKPKARPERESAVSPAASSAAPAVPKADQRTMAPATPDSLKTTSEKERASPVASSATSPTAEGATKPATGGVGSAKGEVLDQILPDVSEKARASIHGKVRVSVTVHVDPSGSVTGAEFDSPGPSKYFADLALQAARKWAFTPPEVSGKSVESEWRLRFEFTQNDTKVIPAQTTP